MTKRDIIAVIAIVAVCHLAYWNSLNGPFQFDDHWQIAGNPNIRNLLDPATIWKHNNPYRFVLMYSFALNHALGAMNAWNYHYTNLLIHAANGILIFFVGRLLLQRLLRRSTEPGAFPAGLAAFAAAIFFTVHPIMTEGVTYISGRSSSLCALFGLLTLLFYMRGRVADEPSRAFLYIGLAAFSAILAMFTKELGATIPLVVLLVEYFCFRRGRGDVSPEESGRKGLLCALPFAAISLLILLYVAYKLLAHRMLTYDEGYISLPYLLTQFKVWALYLAKLIVPLSLNIDHRIPLANALTPDILFPMIFAAALLLAAILMARKTGLPALASFAILWMLLSLLPTSSIFFLRDPMAERHFYFPSIGLFLLFGCIIASAIARAKTAVGEGKARLVPYLPALMLLLVFCGMTFARNTLYSDHLKLWLNVRNQEPQSHRAAYSCALGWMEHALWRKAEGRMDLCAALLKNSRNALRDAYRLGHDESEIHVSLSDVETVQGDFPAAVAYAMQAVYLSTRNAPDIPGEVYSRLIRAYFFAGAADFKNAEAEREQADKLKSIPGREKDAEEKLKNSQGQFESARKNLEACVDAVERPPLPVNYRSEDDYLTATEYYFGANLLLACYYYDHNQMQLAQDYFSKWVASRITHPIQEDVDIAAKFFAAWRDSALGGAQRPGLQPSP
jgi:hypothetical protein